MASSIAKPKQISEAAGNDSEGTGKDGINSAGPGINVQGGGAVGAIICQRDLGGDWGDAQGPDGVPSSGGATDHGDDGKTQGRRRVGVPISRRGDGSLGVPTHHSVYQEAADNHIGEGGLPPRLCTVHRGGTDAGDEADGALVGSRRGK